MGMGMRRMGLRRGPPIQRISIHLRRCLVLWWFVPGQIIKRHFACLLASKAKPRAWARGAGAAKALNVWRPGMMCHLQLGI